MMTIKFLIAFFLFCMITACSKGPDFELESRKIIELLNQNAECYRKKSINCIMDTYLNDSTIVALGTNREFAGKGWNNIKTMYERDLSQGWEMVSYEYLKPVINVSGDIAWITADVASEIKVTIQGEAYNLKLDSRITAVCKKVDDRWKFVLTNFQHFTNPQQALSEEMGKRLQQNAQ